MFDNLEKLYIFEICIVIYNKHLNDVFMIKESNHKWIIDQAKFGFIQCKIIFNDEGAYSEFEFLDLNPAFEELTTIRRQDVFDKKDSENSPDILSFKKLVSESCYKAIKTGEAENELHNDKLKRWFKIQVLCTEKIYFSIIFFDVTKEKEDNTSLIKSKEELESSRAELKAIYEHTPVMMCLIDKNRRLHYANPALAFFLERMKTILSMGGPVAYLVA
jgi:PAS domain-containing protein